MWCFPVAANPFVPIAHPRPVTAQPDIAGLGRGANNFFAGRGRRNHDDAARIVALIGNDDTSADQHSKQQATNPGGRSGAF
jgi:hypothetical protein